MSSTPKITYRSRSTRLPPAASPQPAGTRKRKRPLTVAHNLERPAQTRQKKLTQLHFSLDTTVLRTCPACDLTYTKGAPDDETLHRAHCARVQRGLEWGREEGREAAKAGVEEIASSAKLKNGAKGRIVCFRADTGGKIGAKFALLLETINLTLSSPPLSPEVLQASKVYLFLLHTPRPSASTSTSPTRDKIVGCVIAQRISTAMAIASPSDIATEARTTAAHAPPPSSSPLLSETPADADTPSPTLIPVDTATNLYVHPTPLPTPMGIPRLFVSSTHRRLGIASQLLTAAAENFILGCPLSAENGDVAFTQPTGAGKGVLEKWGKGGARIYEE